MLRRIAFLLATASLLLPAVVAQAPQPKARFEIGPVGVVEPETGEVAVNVTLWAKCLAGDGTGPDTRVIFDLAEQPAYATAYFTPASVSGRFEAQECASPEYEKPFRTQLIVTVTREAPAFEDGRYGVNASVERPGPAPGTDATAVFSTDVGIKNGYLPLLNVNPYMLYVKSPPLKRVLFPVEITNLGNGPTRVKIDLFPLGNKLDSMSSGAEVRGLESTAGDRFAVNKITRYIEVRTPKAGAFDHEPYRFVANFTSTFDGTAPAGVSTRNDSTEITFMVDVRGSAAPNASFPLVATVLAFVVLLARGRGRPFWGQKP